MRPIALALLLAVAAPARAGRVVERVVAVVNDEIVLDSEVEQLATGMMRAPIDRDSSDGKKAWDEIRRKALDQMIEGKLVLGQARELKLTVTAEEVDRAIEEVKKQNKLDDATFVEALKGQGFTLESYRKNLRKQILELKVINTAVRSRVNVSDDDVKMFYKQNERQLSGDKKAHLMQVLIAVADGAPPAEVERRHALAAKVVAEARAGKKFAELAKAYSDDEATKPDGGDLGWIGTGVLIDPLDEVVAGMDAGDVRGPVRSARGFHILYLVERKAGDLRPFDEVKEQIRKQLYDQQVEKTSQQWIRELRKKAHIDIRL
jgi:peptidyl-prolyl cis-trans isomerase SurA